MEERFESYVEIEWAAVMMSYRGSSKAELDI